MKKISSSEAARIMGQIYERVAKGETILLTRYGRPYVLLSPPPPETEEEQEDSGTDRTQED